MESLYIACGINKTSYTIVCKVFQFLFLIVLYHLTLSGNFKGQKFSMGFFWGLARDFFSGSPGDFWGS